MSKAVRKGTATRKTGAETAARIVAAAHDLLESEPLARFSMRNVAELAGVSLANVQYYYPRREDLVRAMFADLDQRYRQAYDRVLANSGGSPLQRFTAVLRYQLEDISRRNTRQFFLQFWALVASIDDFRCAYLGELYQLDIDVLAAHIAPLHDGQLSEEQALGKATLIAAMVEGLMVVQGEADKPGAQAESAFDAALAIAINP